MYTHKSDQKVQVAQYRLCCHVHRSSLGIPVVLDHLYQIIVVAASDKSKVWQIHACACVPTFCFTFGLQIALVFMDSIMHLIFLHLVFVIVFCILFKLKANTYDALLFTAYLGISVLNFPKILSTMLRKIATKSSYLTIDKSFSVFIRLWGMKWRYLHILLVTII